MFFSIVLDKASISVYNEVKETTKELIYLYDESGMIGVIYNSQPYYYHRNLQGDVIAIYDANGEKQVEYAYDAWGNCTTISQANSGLASLNPIRYRGSQIYKIPFDKLLDNLYEQLGI